MEKVMLQSMLLVAPFAGAWIEINFGVAGKLLGVVAPFAGAWIEISATFALAVVLVSLPSRERGLKLLNEDTGDTLDAVAPFAGAWIEM